MSGETVGCGCAEGQEEQGQDEGVDWRFATPKPPSAELEEARAGMVSTLDAAGIPASALVQWAESKGAVDKVPWPSLLSAELYGLPLVPWAKWCASVKGELAAGVDGARAEELRREFNAWADRFGDRAAIKKVETAPIVGMDAGPPVASAPMPAAAPPEPTIFGMKRSTAIGVGVVSTLAALVFAAASDEGKGRRKK